MLDFLENLLDRDLSYHSFMDWPIHPHNISDSDSVKFYQDPRNLNRIVMYQKSFVNEISHQGPYEIEKIQYYYGSKISRSNGPAFKQIKRFYNSKNINHLTSYTVTWTTRGKINRKNKPAEYLFTYDEEQKTHSIQVMNWLKTPKLKNHGSYHRENGPAMTCFDVIRHHQTMDLKFPDMKYFLNGKEYEEYDYWKRVMVKYPKKMPIKVFEDDKKIVFKPTFNKPGPKIFYKNIRKCVFDLEGQKINSFRYWEIVDTKNAISKKWLTV